MDIPSVFRLAKNVSKYSDHRFKIGAVLMKHGKVISVGYNQTKSHPEAWHTGLHAEIKAIKTSGKIEMSNSTMVVYREHKNGTPATAKPCKHCAKAMKDFGIKTIWYTTSEFPFWKRIKL